MSFFFYVDLLRSLLPRRWWSYNPILWGWVSDEFVAQFSWVCTHSLPCRNSYSSMGVVWNLNFIEFFSCVHCTHIHIDRILLLHFCTWIVSHFGVNPRRGILNLLRGSLPREDVSSTFYWFVFSIVDESTDTRWGSFFKLFSPIPLYFSTISKRTQPFCLHSASFPHLHLSMSHLPIVAPVRVSSLTKLVICPHPLVLICTFRMLHKYSTPSILFFYTSYLLLFSPHPLPRNQTCF